MAFGFPYNQPFSCKYIFVKRKKYFWQCWRSILSVIDLLSYKYIFKFPSMTAYHLTSNLCTNIINIQVQEARHLSHFLISFVRVSSSKHLSNELHVFICLWLTDVIMSYSTVRNNHVLYDCNYRQNFSRIFTTVMTTRICYPLPCRIS